jgi:hypothetical protein
MIRKILKILLIIQEQKHQDPFKRWYIKNRLNPYNPLTYISIILIFIVGVLMFGFVGIWKKLDLWHAFKWQ